MSFGLTKKDLEEINEDGVKELIKINEERLQIWSIPDYEKKQIEEEIKELKELLKSIKLCILWINGVDFYV